MPEMTWQEMVKVVQFLQLPVIDLARVPAKVIKQALAVIRARTNE